MPASSLFVGLSHRHRGGHMRAGGNSGDAAGQRPPASRQCDGVGRRPVPRHFVTKINVPGRVRRNGRVNVNVAVDEVLVGSRRGIRAVESQPGCRRSRDVGICFVKDAPTRPCIIELMIGR